MDQHILAILVEDLTFDPLARGIPHVDPLAHFQFSAFKAEGEGVADEVGVEAFNELVDGVLVLLHDFQRLFLLEAEAVDALLQLPELLGLVVLLAVEVGLVHLAPPQGGGVGDLRWYLIGHQLDDIALLNTVVSQGLIRVEDEPTIEKALRLGGHLCLLSEREGTSSIWWWKERMLLRGLMMSS